LIYLRGRISLDKLEKKWQLVDPSYPGKRPLNPYEWYDVPVQADK